jgi:hypothetical protein
MCRTAPCSSIDARSSPSAQRCSDASPTERAQRAELALERALAGSGSGAVTVWSGSETAGLRVDGAMVFYLVAEDFGPAPDVSLDLAADEVRRELQKAVLEVREKGDAARIGEGLAYAAQEAWWHFC